MVVTILVSSLLVELAEREFPRLMRSRNNREDALQTLALTEHATQGEGAVDHARHALAWLEYELGVVAEPPVCPKPWFYPGASESKQTAEERLFELDLELRRLVA
jgi:hypothetical protein